MPLQQMTTILGHLFVYLTFAIVVNSAASSTLFVDRDLAHARPRFYDSALANGFAPVGHIGRSLSPDRTSEHALAVQLAGRSPIKIFRNDGIV